jgi:hypothetical protein
MAEGIIKKSDIEGINEDDVLNEEQFKELWAKYLYENKMPPNYALPGNVIVQAKDLIPGKSYKVYKVTKKGYIQKEKEIKVENTQPTTKYDEYFKPPYYLVPTAKNNLGTFAENVGTTFKDLRNKLSNPFGSSNGGGGKKSRKYRKKRRHTRRRKSRRNSRK